MSDSSNRGLRMHVLAAATAVALSSMALVPATAADRVNLSGLQSSQQYDRFIVKYRAGSQAQASQAILQAKLRQAARALPARASQRALELQRLRTIATGAEVVKTNRKLDRSDAESLMRQLAADPSVEYVEVDQLMKPLYTPNDPSFSQQYGFGTGAGGTYATQAWDIATGSGVVVAVIDTGITNHSDLNANVLPGYDFISDTSVSNDGNGRDADPSDPGDWTTGQCGPASNSSWHGTHVAGTVAAVTNNAKGVAGMAFNAKIVPARVLGTCGGYTSDIADAIIWSSGGSVSGVPANANPAEVLNMSLGGTGACDNTTQSAINGAVGRGSTIVVAAGNSNANVSNHNPGNCANVVSVASTTSTGARSSFSNYGSLIDVAAPGSGILSTLNSGSTTPGSETYASYNGTSMAAPHVAGVVALMQSKASTPLTPANVESLLKSTARAFPSTPSQPIGSGIVNAKAAVDAVGGTPPPPPGGTTLTKGVPVTGLSASTGNSVSYTMTVPAGATNLSFSMSGGTGDADMYVKFGSAPTDSSYDCRPYLNGNAETCSFASPSAGTYYIRVKAYSSFSGVSLVGNYTEGASNTPPVANFTFTTNGLTASFTDTSTDSDGSIASRSWNFGDGTSSTATNPSHTYASAGTYTVTETVTDNDGASSSKSASVTVASSSGTTLTKGVPVTGLSASTGTSITYTMVVPSGASNLTFTSSGGTGDADMYVKFGSAPTDSSYDCRPYKNGNAESCTYASPAAGTYYVRLKAYSSFSGVSLVGDYTTGGGGSPQTYSNTGNYTISDNSTVESPITVSGRSGNGSSSTPVAVDIRHTYIGDLKVDLVAPDGSVYTLHNRSGGSADNIITTYSVNLSGEALNGTWKLRVNDNYNGDTGYINSWSVTF